MAFWYETSRRRVGLSRYAADYKTRQIVMRSQQEPDWFEAYYVRQLNLGPNPPYEECVQLWPLEPIRTRTAQDAVARALLLLEVAASGTQDALFDIRPCPMPMHRKEVGGQASPTHHAQAIIYRHNATRYEICYFADIIGSEEKGWRFSVPPADGTHIPNGFERRTFADSLESAEQIAVLELARLVASHHEIMPLRQES